MRVRLRLLLHIGGAAAIIYLVTHVYINYKLSREEDKEEATSTAVFSCSSFPRPQWLVLEKLPQKLKEGIFFLPTKLEFMKPSSSVPLTYSVDNKFPPLTSNGEAEHFIRLVRKVTNLFSKGNVTYMLWRGSLLGSFMTHGMLPWDDDVDFLVKWSDMPKVKSILRDSKSMWKIYNVTGYGDDADLYSQSLLTKGDYWGETVPNPAKRVRNHRFKFFAIDSLRAGNSSWKWPNLDINFYKENRTHVWGFEGSEGSDIVPKNIVFPLHQRPFGSLWLPSPKDTHKYLVTRYGTDFRCQTSHRNHRQAKLRESLEVPCCSLYWTYPIVFREAAEGGVIETLMLGNETLHSLFVKEKSHPLQAPYQL